MPNTDSVGDNVLNIHNFTPNFRFDYLKSSPQESELLMYNVNILYGLNIGLHQITHTHTHTSHLDFTLGFAFDYVNSHLNTSNHAPTLQSDLLI